MSLLDWWWYLINSRKELLIDIWLNELPGTKTQVAGVAGLNRFDSPSI